MVVVRRRLLAGVAMFASASGSALAGPNGGTVVGGSASIQGAGTGSVTINQSSQNAIINWQTFNIGKGEITTFNQPNSSSIALNRVIGGHGPSFLDGTLTANGRVVIVNGDGVLIGPNGSITTAGFLATTSDIRDADFMAGKYNFNIPGRPDASIANLGSITATSGGFAALVAPGVRNSGTITATLGTVSLAAGNAFTLDFYGDRLITLAVNDQIAGAVKDVQTGETLKSLVGNTGKLSANGGRVELTAAAARAVVDSVINNKGVIEANSVGTRNGMIVLSGATSASKPTGAPTQTVKLAGRISAGGKDKGTKGGTVVVTGESIALNGVSIDASGDSGGGKVLIGGDTGGGHPGAAASAIELAKLESFGMPTATTVSVDAASTINVSATGQGNAGKAIVWSDQQTMFAGTILAQGGASGGNGGFVETSSHGSLGFGGMVDLSARTGHRGTLLLDPLNATIDINPGNQVITVASIQGALATGDVIVSTNVAGSDFGNITVVASVNWTNASTLTLSADKNITVNTGVTIANSSAGNLVLRADSAGTGVGTVNFNGTGKVDFLGSTGTVSIFYNPADNPASSVVNAKRFSSPKDYSPYVLTNNAVPNQLTAYMLVNNVYDLQNIQNNLSGAYALGRNIDASTTVSWNGGAGFVPIGGTLAPFTGTLDGEGGKIDKLTINLPSTSGVDIGLFADIGSPGLLFNFGLTNATIIGHTVFFGGADIVGGIAGLNQGAIRQVYMSGSVKGNGGFLGGLAGQNTGNITQSYANDTVTGDVVIGGGFSGGGYVGGLVGVNSGNISHSYTTGSVGGGQDTGGLVGRNFLGTVSQSYSTAEVRGGFGATGGLVGTNGFNAIVTQSYATGTVTESDIDAPGAFAIGGLVGGNTGTISKSYATGAVTVGSISYTGSVVCLCFGGGPSSAIAYTAVGGLVGLNSGTITQTFATGSVTSGSVGLNAASFVGGLVGKSTGTANESYATGQVAGDQQSVNALIGGFIGLNFGVVQNSYWNAFTTNQQYAYGDQTNDGSTALTSEPSHSSSATFALAKGSYGAFDFSNAWNINSTTNNGYPYLLGLNAGTPPPLRSSTILTPSAVKMITVDANPQTKVFGSSDPNFTYTVVSGNLGSATFSGTLGRASGENVGSYDIGEGTLSLPAGYQVNFIDSNLAIAARPITVLADGKSRQFGDPNPPLTYLVGGAGLVNGDTVSGSLTTSGTTTSNVGQYPITEGTIALSSNYALSFVGNNLTIKSRAITVTADPQNIVQGDQIPTLTYAVGGLGLVNGDKLTGALTTSAMPSSDAGQYPILQGSLAASSNYNLTYQASTLTVNSAPSTGPKPNPIGPSQPACVLCSLGPQTAVIANLSSPDWNIANSTKPVVTLVPTSSALTAGVGVKPIDFINHLTVPALEALLEPAFRDFENYLPPDLASAFKTEMGAKVNTILQNSKLTISSGVLTLVAFAFDELASAYIDKLTDRLYAHYDPIKGALIAGLANYILKATADTIGVYITDPNLLSAGWVGARAASIVGMSQATIDEVIGDIRAVSGF